MKKIRIVSIVVFLVLLATIGIVLFSAFRKATRLPANTPAAFLDSKPATREKPVIICAGDSITHGAVCANYVDLLEKRLGMEATIINAGVNSRLAYNVVQALDDIIACRPDVVTVLIGTNDANSRMSRENEQRYIKSWKLPVVPDAEWFRKNLDIIAARLTTETNARVAFLSLPTMGEVPDHPAFVMSTKYSGIIKEVAADYDLTYLPLHETMVGYLASHPGGTKYDFADMRSLMVKNIVRHYIFGQSYNHIAVVNGFSLHVDHLHLNRIGANMVANLIEAFIHSEPH